MMECQNLGRLDHEAFEPSWIFSTADAYVEMDLGQDSSSTEAEEVKMPQSFRRPWFKLNYPLPSRASLRLYRRPYFHLAED